MKNKAMRRRRMAVAETLGLLGAMVFVAASQSERTLKPAEEIMWRKLDLAHDTLDGLVLEDFEALEAYAEDLVSLSQAGERFVLDSEAYLEESREFRRAARELGRAARGRELEAATLAYVDLTLRCIRCHRMLGSLPRR
jgi:hypothetical protein